ncbi:uncharacterized protein LOC131228526 isoform X2 [Magnolia sinica]|nr:uncharacterized protein LOC131228526 isoform X2 [Magnolia sinica]
MEPASSDPSSPKRENLSVNDEKPADLGERDGPEGGFDPGGPGRSQKKAKVDGGEDMKRVAEIVMVLSAMGKLRGGRSPSSAERGMMVEAREKLAGMCEFTVAPKDLVTRDVVRAVVDDLGFSRWKDQRFGFRMPRMSIAEKVAFMERKMEDSKELAPRPVPYSGQPLQAGFGANSDSHGSLFHVGATHRFPPDKQSPMPMLSRGFHLASPAGPVSAPASVSSLNQSQFSEVQPAISRLTSSSSPIESDSSSLALPRTEASHFILGGRSNGLPYLSQVGATSGDRLVEKTPASHSSQSSTAAASAVGQATKVPDCAPMMADGSPEINAFQLASQAINDQISKSFAVQTAAGNLHAVHQPLQVTGFVQAPSLYSNHNDIARNVQKFLQPRIPDRPNWTPPTDYMTKPLTCQLCKVTINDAESLLVCDACEKGVHLKCLQSFLPKVIHKEDWHCPRCLIVSNGKPLLPKYGRISRNISVSMASANTSGVQTSPENRMGSPDQKVNHQKMLANGKHGLLNPAHVASVGNNHVESAPDMKMLDAREVPGSDVSICGRKMDGGPSQGTKDHSQERAEVVCVPAGTPNERADQHDQKSKLSQSGMEISTFAPKLLPNGESGNFCSGKLSDAGISTCRQSEASCSSQVDGKTQVQNCSKVSADQMHEMGRHTGEELKRPDLTEACEYKPGLVVKQEDQDAAQVVSGGTLDNGNGARDCSRSSLEGLHSVDWVGGILHVVDEKAYYESCCINGIVYKLQDHALFHFNDHNLLPSKIQVLWEDNKTRLKWATVNRCYLPSDLPEVVGQPCTPENNEVYESNNGITILVGSILGPCKVLAPNKFKEEIERRINMEHGASSGLQPIFLCK